MTTPVKTKDLQATGEGSAVLSARDIELMMDDLDNACILIAKVSRRLDFFRREALGQMRLPFKD